MRVLFVGATPPPGGEDSRRFGSAAGARSLAGDVVEVHAPGRVSVAHLALSMRPAALVRDLKEHSGAFDEVVLRIERDRPVRFEHGGALRRRGIARLLRALEGYAAVTLFVDAASPAVASASAEDVRLLFARATSIVVADDTERGAIAALDPRAAEKCSVAVALPAREPLGRAWPGVASPALWSASLREIRRRSGELSSAASPLVDPVGTARPSLKGASIWLIRRVIGKTRGAVTKLLRP